MTNEQMKTLLNGMRQDRLNYRDKLLTIKSTGATYDWDDGRNIDDAILREDTAVQNLDKAILRLS